MNQTTIEKASELIDEIKASESYQALLKLDQAIQLDTHCQALIDTFQTCQSQFESIKQYGKFHPEYKMYSRALMDAKEALYSEPLIVEYKRLQRALQATLDTVAEALSQAVSPYIKTQTSIKI